MDYTIKKYERGILSAEEVHFFYYGIMRNTEDCIQFTYDWNNDIQDYLNSKEIVIEAKEKDAFPAIAEKNKLYFIVSEKDENNKAVALFRHLRNAFAHFRIIHEAEYLSIEDGHWNAKDECLERTMIGQIKYEDLKKLCFLFFKQGDKFIEENNIKAVIL